MGVAVLKPEDCLKLPYPMKHPKNACPNPNPNPNRMNRTQPNRKKRTPNTSPTFRPTVGSKSPAKNLVMGEVKILKRGEELNKTASEKPIRVEKENVDVDLGSTNRLGPDPGSVPMQIRLTESNKNRNKVVPAAFYAGSAFITSPPPSSVPMPAFFTKKTGAAVKNVDATTDLRRILRLDL
ncbi:uncharacterized protein LOC111299394 [Durio zibethinus]|uniref:Uncharacterized protein LOC111299394 n=1 Tax=Durio zibethinus TaxID=66656 RepID=A0A6P5ZBW7_DURZI|nr:uncharacterized protein LOC111299394 [Durio zibethinus]